LVPWNNNQPRLQAGKLQFNRKNQPGSSWKPILAAYQATLSFQSFFSLQTPSSVGPPQVAHLLNANHFGTLPSKEEAKRIVTVPEHDAIRHVTN